MKKLCSLLVVSFAAIGLVGCGGGAERKPTAEVTGVVFYEGKPVTGGTVYFAPRGEGTTPGKGGAGYVQADGTFTVGTYKDDDGAVIGNHAISYEPPAPELIGTPSTSSGQPAAAVRTIRSPYTGLVPSKTEVAVRNSGNVFEIDLVKN